MEQLRRTGFHDPTMSLTSKDEFDAQSVHVVAHLDGTLAGMVRMTPEPPSVLQTWFRGQAPLPTGAGVVDANRAVVGEKFRGLGIYKVLMLEALAWAHEQNFTNIVGAIEPTFPLRDFLKQTGCEEAGQPLLAWHPPVAETLVQCILWRAGNYRPKVTALRDRLTSELNGKGLRISGPHCFTS